MTLASLLNRAVTIVRRSPGETGDSYGNPIPEETTVITVGELQQEQRTERTEADEVSETRWRLILGPAEAINTGDAVIVDGEAYELIGDPWRARNPRTGAFSHIEATLRRVAGSGDEVGS